MTIKKVSKNGTVQWTAKKPVSVEWTRTFKNKEDAAAWMRKK